jgi:hypothetical protein
VVAFGRRDVEFRRMFGMPTVNGVTFSRLPSFSQITAIQIVAEFDDPSVKTEADLNRWAAKLGTESRKFSVEGVLLKLEDGTELPVPFFMFSEADLYALRPVTSSGKTRKRVRKVERGKISCCNCRLKSMLGAVWNRGKSK